MQLTHNNSPLHISYSDIYHAKTIHIDGKPATRITTVDKDVYDVTEPLSYILSQEEQDNPSA